MATRIFFNGSAASTVVSNGKQKEIVYNSEKGKMTFPTDDLLSCHLSSENWFNNSAARSMLNHSFCLDSWYDATN
jgi:hypothetical protein